MTYRLGLLARWALALGVASAVLSGCKSEAHPQSAPPPEVSIIEVRPGPVTVFDEYVAQTQAPDTIEIRAQVTGLLERQAFPDGARVKKGDLLYVIDQRPFEAQAAQAKAGLAQAEANLVNAKQNLARNARLSAEKAVSQQDYDTAVAQERASTALVSACICPLCRYYSPDRSSSSARSASYWDSSHAPWHCSDRCIC
jgi:membrane fusion protein (multidrug efflux system)